MDTMRFLFIPAGGYSQRLPNLTVLGKLFSPLPFGNDQYQMLDLILASYLPFLKHMPPGVFLASSDAIISYTLDDDGSWTFENDGFTALAHPSPIAIGTTHGVYVVSQNQDFGVKSAFLSECLRVLQKPSIEEMHEKGAVIKNISDSGDVEDVIFSDSAFFFDHSVTKKLISIYEKHKPLKSELSSYGDFLQPLGLSASPAYIMSKLTSEELASMRTVLYRELFGTRLSILIMKNSKFHHLGTMPEYVDNLCSRTDFAKDFPLAPFSFSSFSVSKIEPLYIEGTIIHSIIHPLSSVPKSTVLEYCHLDIAVEFGNNCIVSNIRLPGVPVQKMPLVLPDNTLIHTIPLDNGFVTIAFSIEEDIKKSWERHKASHLNFFGKELHRFLKCNASVFNSDCDKVSLWEARLFPVCQTPCESFKKTLELVLCLVESDEKCSDFSLTRENVEWMSMKDILTRKDTEKMLNYQNCLYEKIRASLNS